MNRCIAFIGALLLAFITISSACTAASSDWFHFTIQPQYGSDLLEARFAKQDTPHNQDWSARFRPSELVGLDIAGFRGTGRRPLRFAVIREAGRMDCSGDGGESYATGDCIFTADPRFAALLASRGIGRPTADQAFGLMAVNARRELIDTLAAARYPTPSIDNLMALSAIGVNATYIKDMSNAGYRPRSLDALIQFKALNITPQWIAGFTRIGYAGLPANELVQLKALAITPEFIESFDRIGYRHLPVEKLVQLKALDITPEFVRSVATAGAPMPSVDKLATLRMVGRRR